MAIAKACSCKFCMRSYRLPSVTFYYNSSHDSLLYCFLFFSFLFFFSLVAFWQSGSKYNLRSTNSRLLVPFKTVDDRSFAVTAPSLWNSLPAELRTISDLSSLKLQLQTHLFGAAFYQQECEFHYSFSLQYCNYNFISNLDTALIIILYVTLLFR